MPVRHGQTSARRLRLAGKRTALARWTRLRRPRPAVDGGEAARRDGFVPKGQLEISQTQRVWCIADEINVLKGHRNPSDIFHRPAGTNVFIVHQPATS